MPEVEPRRRDLPYLELGTTGLKRYGGMVYEEFLPELSGQRAITVYKEMSSNDPVVSAVLFSIEMLIRQTKWQVEAIGDSATDQAAAEFLESCMQDMSSSWEDQLAEILSFLIYGWSYHEIVYKRRLGPKERDPARRSRYSDGRVGWRKFPIRSQDTLYKWEFDESGGVQGMWQMAPPDYQTRFIPIEKALLFRTTTHKGSPEGRSILRGAYRPWYFKKHIENIEGIGIERDLAGLPIAYVPPELLEPSASAEERAVLEAIKTMVVNVRRDEQEGIVFPQAYDDNGHKLYDFSLLTTGGRRQFDTDAVITRYDQRISMTVLADFILLGHTQTGSFALSSDKTEIFSTALSAWLDGIASVFNRHAIPRLFEMNDFQIDELPQLTYGELETPSMADIGGFITQLSGAGAELFPDTELENHLRGLAGLPLKEVSDSG